MGHHLNQQNDASFESAELCHVDVPPAPATPAAHEGLNLKALALVAASEHPLQPSTAISSAPLGSPPILTPPLRVIPLRI